MQSRIISKLGSRHNLLFNKINKIYSKRKEIRIRKNKKLNRKGEIIIMISLMTISIIMKIIMNRITVIITLPITTILMNLMKIRLNWKKIILLSRIHKINSRSKKIKIILRKIMLNLLEKKKSLKNKF